jgi:hypothetical protein
MILILVLVALIAICVLAATHGVDSRFDRPGRQF